MVFLCFIAPFGVYCLYGLVSSANEFAEALKFERRGNNMAASQTPTLSKTIVQHFNDGGGWRTHSAPAGTRVRILSACKSSAGVVSYEVEMIKRPSYRLLVNANELNADPDTLKFYDERAQ